MVQAANPKPVHWVLFTGQRMATAFPSRWVVCYPVSFHSYPVHAGTGGPPKDKEQAKADEYSQKVIAKARALVQNTLQKRAMAGFK